MTNSLALVRIYRVIPEMPRWYERVYFWLFADCPGCGRDAHPTPDPLEIRTPRYCACGASVIR